MYLLQVPTYCLHVYMLYMYYHEIETYSANAFLPIYIWIDRPKLEPGELGFTSAYSHPRLAACLRSKESSSPRGKAGSVSHGFQLWQHVTQGATASRPIVEAPMS